jgi:S-adenosylmethionine:tRNA ribosyltransferase-isomerase
MRNETAMTSAPRSRPATGKRDQELYQHTENLGFVPIIRSEEYRYILPESRIARYPTDKRDECKLLVADMRKTDASLPRIRHSVFARLAEELPEGALLVANDSRVIAARLPATKPTGGQAEIFCLEPLSPSRDPAITLAARNEGRCRWKCMTGGRKIASGDILTLYSVGGESTNRQCEARIIAKDGAEALVEFSWSPEEESFAEVLAHFGRTPLPPYIKRADEPQDKTRYQTVYAREDGSVAAPTAGLHFTAEAIENLARKNIAMEYVTLHVGAGTFKPLVAEEARAHDMHEERIFARRETLERLARHALQRENFQRENAQRESGGSGKPIVAVGTTSLRTIESLYWWGVRLLASDNGEGAEERLFVGQWDAFRLQAMFGDKLPAPSVALLSVLEWMRRYGLESASGETKIMLAPGCRFAVADGLITNFHQPESTLILLVAAFLSAGANSSSWQAVYQEALQNDYRFLSYGDSSLLWRAESLGVL